MNKPNVREVTISNMIYFVGYLTDLREGEDAWHTGPCESLTIASQRLELYRRGREVSEAGPQQASRRQLEALDKWLSRLARPEDASIDRATVRAALESGTLSDEWVWVSVLFVTHFHELPREVTHAGGTRIRRGARGPIPVPAAGQTSLTRSS